MFEGLKHRFGKYQLQRVRSKNIHKPVSLNFKNIKRLGVLYTCRDQKDFELVKSFFDALPKTIQVQSLGFFEQKELENYHIQPPEYRFFTLKDMNWYYRPVGEVVSHFIYEPFDVLMDLSLKQKLPLEFILADAHARLIAGRKTNDHIHDIMVDIDKQPDMEYLIEQLIRYLGMIKT